MTTLEVFDGSHAPELLAGDLATIGELPESARGALWTVIEPAILDPLPPSSEARLSEFAATHRIAPQLLARTLRGLRVFYRAAAQTSAPKAKVERDVTTLLGDAAPNALAVIGRYYQPAMGVLSTEIQTKSVVGHGKVLTDFSWRVSRLTMSNHGRGIDLPLVTLTLRYQEGGQSHTITLDALPGVLTKLRDVLTSLLA